MCDEGDGHEEKLPFKCFNVPLFSGWQRRMMYACPTFWLVSGLHLARVKFSPPNAFAELSLALQPLSTRRRTVYLHEVATAYCGDSGGCHSCQTKRLTNEMREVERGSESTN